MIVALSHASIFHWSERPDCDNQKLAIGYWQASRVHVLVGNASERRGWARYAFPTARGRPFFLAYAHEALARAHKAMGDGARTAHHLAAARALFALVKDEENRDRLESDLRELA